MELMHAQESRRCQYNVTTKSNPELTISRFEKALKMFDIKENENCCNIPQKKIRLGSGHNREKLTIYVG